jgi:hypothetical protein
MKGIFELKSARDLLAKLRRDYERLRSAPANSDVAFDFVVTAWHLHEWQYPDSANLAIRRTEVRNANLVLLICEQLAVGAKHFEGRDKRMKSVASAVRQGAWAADTWRPGTWREGSWASSLVVTLTGSAQAVFGDEITMSQFADHVMQYFETASGI